jgi:glycosyltransferase involved in cell wall biosynthesis
MNICLFTKTTLAHGLGGVEVHVETLSRTVPAVGHTLTILATRHPEGKKTEERPGCVIHYLEGTRPARYNKAFFRAADMKFRELHGKNPFDAAWAEDFAAYGSLDTLQKTGVPLLSIMQGSDLRGLIRSEWNRVDSASESIRFFMKFLPEAFIFYSFWYGRVSRKSTIVAAVSRETAEEYGSDHSVQRKNLRVVFNSVDTDRFSSNLEARRRLREQRGLNENDPVILMAAVIHKQKGMHIGLDCFQSISKDHPRARLWVAGDGPHLSDLKRLASDLGILDRTEFFGAVKNDELPDYYNAADIYLNPTLRHEGLPIATVEAMSCGKPAVISRIGGTPSTIEEGVSGFFASPGDAEKIRTRLSQLLDDDALRMSMGEKARQRAVMFFSQEKMARELLSLTESLKGKNHHA